MSNKNNFKESDVVLVLKKEAKKDKIAILQRFFKTGPGEYGEGDIFLGVMVPEQRKIAKKFRNLELDKVVKLLHSKVHEVRLTALFIIIYQFEKGDNKKQKRIYNIYLNNAKRVNNWDLVDLSAPKIVGQYLLNKPRGILYKLIKSNNLWERRIAVLSTLTFIKKNDYIDTLVLSEKLIGDKHDLIHKAVGWMLREIGKKDELVLLGFLNKYFKKMPRTMLRYSIEKLDNNQRKYYMS